MPMNYESVIETLKCHEGLKLKPYTCPAGKLTIGYGRNLEDRGITKHEAEMMLLSDVAEIDDQLMDCPAYRKLDDARKGVLINMAYNLGYRGLMSFRLMWAAISLGNYQGAAMQMLDSKWRHQVGDRAVELSEIMRFGKVV